MRQSLLLGSSMRCRFLDQLDIAMFLLGAPILSMQTKLPHLHETTSFTATELTY